MGVPGPPRLPPDPPTLKVPRVLLVSVFKPLVLRTTEKVAVRGDRTHRPERGPEWHMRGSTLPVGARPQGPQGLTRSPSLPLGWGLHSSGAGCALWAGLCPCMLNFSQDALGKAVISTAIGVQSEVFFPRVLACVSAGLASTVLNGCLGRLVLAPRSAGDCTALQGLPLLSAASCEGQV